jgi:hypothetical protein
MEMCRWDEEECVRSLFGVVKRLQRRQQYGVRNIKDSKAVGWAVMETGEMEVVIFLVCFRLLPGVGAEWRGGGGEEYRPEILWCFLVFAGPVVNQGG